VDQARSRVALAEATLAQRQGTLEEATARYLETVGTLPGGLRRPNDPQELAPPALATVLARALAASPAIKAAGANVVARAADRTATEGAFWPRFTFEVAGRADHNIDGTRGPDSDLIAQLRMTYNIYAGGADTARERRAIEDVVAAKFDELEARRCTRPSRSLPE
jgi:adhesin transport system outer membrane protein